jgi:catechol 2,3-dioxygenase-like lactoylglutathione lyase family enzyme
VIDHLEIRTRDMAAHVRFYADVLAPLGYTLRADAAAKGFGDDNGLDFFIVEGEPTTGAHYAFTVASRDVVDRVHQIARSEGHALDRAPALAPHIHPHYYAGYLRDPDGRLVEFVCHKPVRDAASP